MRGTCECQQGVSSRNKQEPLGTSLFRFSKVGDSIFESPTVGASFKFKFKFALRYSNVRPSAASGISLEAEPSACEY